MTEKNDSSSGFKAATAYLIAEANKMKWHKVSFFMRKAARMIEHDAKKSEKDALRDPEDKT